MNIWYFNPYAGGPGLGKYVRAYHLVRAWRKLGHETTVFVASFHHLLDKPEPLSGKVEIDGVAYVPLAARPYQGNGVARLLNFADYCRAASRLPGRVPGEFAKPDAIIVSSPHPFAILPAARRAGNSCWNSSATIESPATTWHGSKRRGPAAEAQPAGARALTHHRSRPSSARRRAGVGRHSSFPAPRLLHGDGSRPAPG